MPSNPYPKKCRLSKAGDFHKVFRQGQKLITATLIIRFYPAVSDTSRLGLAVPRKVGNAVQRNRVKRRIREAFRLTRRSFPMAMDLVISPRKGILEKPFEDYLSSFVLLKGRLSSLKNRKGSPRVK